MLRRVLPPVLVATFVAICIAAGIWQLGRLSDRRAFNDRLLSRGALPVVDIGTLDGDAEQIAYRRVTATGTFDVDREIILLSRSYRGLSGHHVVTPLITDHGRALLVDRGWVPLTFDEPPVAEAPPPPGRVSVEGVLLPSQVRGRFGPRLPDEGPHSQVFRIEIPFLAPQFPYELYPVYLQMEEQRPPSAGEHPIIVAAPGLDEGPHLAYAIQWFLFAVAASVTYLAARNRRRSKATP